MFLKLTLWGYGLQSPLNESEILDSGLTDWISSLRTYAKDFNFPKKIHRYQPDLMREHYPETSEAASYPYKL